MSPRLPTFIIAGAMRCGTSSLNAYLREHPEIGVSRPKEVHFFDVNFDRGLDWYLTHFEETGDAIAIGEATPDYLYDLQACQRIADALPDIRILVLLRDPADRAYSHFWHNRSVGKEQLDFIPAIETEAARLARGPEERARFSYVDRGRYGPQLERLLSHIPAERVLAQTFDQLESDPAAVYRKTCAFIGVDPGELPANLGETVNAYTRYRSTAVRRAGKALPKRMRNAVARLNRVDAGGYERLTTEAREMVREAIGTSNRGVADLVGLRAPWLA